MLRLIKIERVQKIKMRLHTIVFPMAISKAIPTLVCFSWHDLIILVPKKFKL